MKIKIKGFIQKSPHREGFHFCASDMSQYGYITVGEVDTEIDYDIPADWNPVAAEVAALNKHLQEISDEHHAKVRQIKGRIAELLCIENGAA
jgi:hypothetical protein